MDQSDRIISCLSSFAIAAALVDVIEGPRVTRYELSISPGVRVSKLRSLADDLTLALSADIVRVEAPVPGRGTVAVEVARASFEPVMLMPLLNERPAWGRLTALGCVIGVNIGGETVMLDLAEAPHLLIAGATGSGKSVCLNAIIVSLFTHYRPDELRLVLIDPKRVEMSCYRGLPHLAIPIANGVDESLAVLHWCVGQIEDRYIKLEEASVRNIAGYNEGRGLAERLPRLVVIIDEAADLITMGGADLERRICRIAQLGRACGVHLVLATQRPDRFVITGAIKANIPTRIGLATASQMDSRVILDISGAERLLGRGDMLLCGVGALPRRVQGAYIDVPAVAELVDQAQSHYLDVEFCEFAVPVSGRPGTAVYPTMPRYTAWLASSDFRASPIISYDPAGRMLASWSDGMVEVGPVI